MEPFTNISGYKFTLLHELRSLREPLMARCRQWGLKGTILLSPEGINLFVAGRRNEIDLLLVLLRTIPGLGDLQVKESESKSQPFSRMLVRIKKEIIAFNVAGVAPGTKTSRKLSPATLKQWLDEGRPLTLLDTRNDYEVKLGTFQGAVPIGIGHFRDFPAAARELPEKMKDEAIVMFCTGGIRCEKAGPFMEMLGFRNVFQLDGGILRYFDECGSDHYRGECFVFDQRVGVDSALSETESAQCLACQTPLTLDEQQDPRYVYARSCPHCFKDPDEQRRLDLEKRQQAILRLTNPLPGTERSVHHLPARVPEAYDGRTLIEFLSGVFGEGTRPSWQTACDGHSLLDDRHRPAAADRRVCTGEIYLRPGILEAEPPVAAGIRLLYEDEAILVLDKPAPLPMRPSGPFHRNTLQWILNCAYEPGIPRAAYLLDPRSTGVILYSRTQRVATLLRGQFGRKEAETVHLVRCKESPKKEAFVHESPIGGKADPGSVRTDFRILRRFDDGTMLCEARPAGGGSDPIRSHLDQLGYPIVGDGPMGAPKTDALCLHAWRCTFIHPLSNKPLAFDVPAPLWSEAGWDLEAGAMPVVGWPDKTFAARAAARNLRG